MVRTRFIAGLIASAIILPMAFGIAWLTDRPNIAGGALFGTGVALLCLTIAECRRNA